MVWEYMKNLTRRIKVSQLNWRDSQDQGIITVDRLAYQSEKLIRVYEAEAISSAQREKIKL